MLNSIYLSLLFKASGCTVGHKIRVTRARAKIAVCAVLWQAVCCREHSSGHAVARAMLSTKDCNFGTRSHGPYCYVKRIILLWTAIILWPTVHTTVEPFYKRHAPGSSSRLLYEVALISRVPYAHFLINPCFDVGALVSLICNCLLHQSLL